MRIASLVPSATELLFDLGLGDEVAAVTHECDHPAEAASRPHLTRSVVPAGLDAAGIDAEVRRLSGEGRALYELDVALLERLEVDLIVTQAVCPVCAVDFDDVASVASGLPSRPEVLSLDPTSLGEVLDDVNRAADAAGVAGSGRELRAELEGRLEGVREAVAGAAPPRVASLEWLDPPFSAGHWIPEMVGTAGGVEVLGTAAARSRQLGWEEIAAAAPEHAVSMPCGWDLERSTTETESHRESILAAGAGRIDAVDAAASFSRPGPRLVDGVELLAHLFHPDRTADPGSIGFRRLA